MGPSSPPKYKKRTAPLIEDLALPADRVDEKRRVRRPDEEMAVERDLALWSEELPDYKQEAKFQGNLGLRLLKGITGKEIKAMTIRDRVGAANTCFTNRNLLLDRPTENIHFQQRKDLLSSLGDIQAEMARRAKERATIDITPTGETP